MLQSFWKDVEGGWQDLYNNVFARKPHPDEDNLEGDRGSADGSFTTSAHGRSEFDARRSSRASIMSSATGFSETGRSRRATEIMSRRSRLETRGTVFNESVAASTEARSRKGSVAESSALSNEELAIMDPSLYRRIRATSDMETGMEVFEGAGGGRTNQAMPELDGFSSSRRPTARHVTEKIRAPQPKRAVDALDRTADRPAYIEEEFATVLGGQMVVQRALEEDARIAQSKIQIAEADALPDVPLDQQKLPSYFEKQNPEAVDTDSDDPDLGDADERAKEIEECERELQEQMQAIFQQGGSHGTVPKKVRQWWDASGVNRPLREGHSHRRLRARGGGGTDSASMPGSPPHGLASSSVIGESKDFQEYGTSRPRMEPEFRSGTASGSMNLPRGGSVMSMTSVGGPGSAPEFSADYLAEMTQKSAAMADVPPEDAGQFYRVDEAYRMLKQECGLFEHIQEKMCEEGHMLVYDRGPVKKAAAAREDEQPAALEPQELQPPQPSDPPALRREISAPGQPDLGPVGNIGDLGERVASSVRSMFGGVEAKHFHGAASHVANRGGGADGVPTKSSTRRSKR